MSDKTKEVTQRAGLSNAHTLVIKSTHEYKVHGPYGSNYEHRLGLQVGAPLWF